MRLKDVAQLAGVAVNTASTILNQRPNSWASEKTRERVMKAAAELGYRPNRAALALQSGRFNTIGLLVADLDTPYFCHFESYFNFFFLSKFLFDISEVRLTTLFAVSDFILSS